jgi:hypothetical protein
MKQLEICSALSNRVESADELETISVFPPSLKASGRQAKHQKITFAIWI